MRILKANLSQMWPRWQSRKALNSPPPTEHQMTTIYKETVCENDPKINRKDSPQIHKEGTTRRWVGGVEMQYIKDIPPG